MLQPVRPWTTFGPGTVSHLATELTRVFALLDLQLVNWRKKYFHAHARYADDDAWKAQMMLGRRRLHKTFTKIWQNQSSSEVIPAGMV